MSNKIMFLGDILGEGKRIQTIDINQYPDGMPLITARPVDIKRILIRPNNLSDFMAAMFWIDARHERGFSTPELIIPYFPGARQDRLNLTGDYLFTVKSIAKEINMRFFPGVTIVDPHSEVAPALIDRCRVVSTHNYISIPEGKYRAIISPDAGAEKRAGKVAQKLGIPLLHAWKTRNVTTGVITGFGFEPITYGDSKLLIVDDICDGGGTFTGLADAISDDRKQTGGPRIKLDLFVTHGMFTKGTEILTTRFGHVYCTDSVDGPRENIIEIPICDKLLLGRL